MTAVLASWLLFALFSLGIWLAIHNLLPFLSYVIIRARDIALRQIERHEKLATLLGRRETGWERWKSWAPVLSILIAGFAASALTGWVFAELAEDLREASPRLLAIDERIHGAAVNLHTRAGTDFFTFFTVVGTPVGLALLCVIASILLAIERRYRWVAYLAVTTGVGALLNLSLKTYFARERPDLSIALRHASGYSFPSGHAMGAAVVFGALAYLGVRRFTTWRARSAILAIATTSIIAIALSRIYLGVHWVTDIVAGISAGTLWVITATLAYETFRRVRLLRSRAEGSGSSDRV
jgi:membrane-associated phospholipid phosphatase